MIGWEHLTGEKVTFESDIDSSTVTYFRPQLGGSHGGSNDSKTTPKTTPKKISKTEKVHSIIRSTPNITKEEIAKLTGLTKDGVIYHIDKLKKEGEIEWQGHSRTGKWVIKY